MKKNKNSINNYIMTRTEVILLIINICISSVTSLFLPLFQSLSFCIKHIKKIDSCGAKIDLRSPIKKRKKENSE